MILGSPLAPATAQAAELKVWCLQAYADHTPKAPCNPATFALEPAADPDTVTPLSDPLGTLNSSHRGSVVVEGNATPGSRVEVSISDGTKSIVRIAQAAPEPDPGSGTRAGDFEVLFDPKSDLSTSPLTVQELGIHAVPPGTDPSTTDPFKLGRFVLTVSARARSQDGTQASAPMSVPIVKLAATPGDTGSPELLDLRFPPTHWCHYAGEGITVGGTHPGGGADGRCGGVGPVPDVTWAACTTLFRAGDNPTTPQDESSICRAPVNRSFPRQEAPLSGLALDDVSEIKTVTITITRGEEVVRTYTDWFARSSSTSGAWGWSLKINDFAPSWPGTGYLITVLVEDAWGNQTEASSTFINVYPW